MREIAYFMSCWIVSAIVLCCHGKPTPETSNDEGLWQPLDGRSRADWLACNGMPCADWIRVQQIMTELNLIEYESRQQNKQVPKPLLTTLFGENIEASQDTTSSKYQQEELDILLTLEEAEEILRQAQAGDSLREKRKVKNDEYARWEMPIKYVFDGSHSVSDQEKITQALQSWQRETCLQFEKRPAGDTSLRGTSHIVFSIGTYGNRCASFVGRKFRSGQEVSLAKTCLWKPGTALHEIGHALGLWHEHQRHNRDDYIQVNKTNVYLWAYSNFNKYDHSKNKDFGVPYDVNSVMHYAPNTGSRNGQPTIKVRDELYGHNIGQREELSFLDIKVINLAYCQDHCSPNELQEECANGGYQDPRDCTRCRCPPGLGGVSCKSVQEDRDCGEHRYLSPGQEYTISSLNYDSDGYSRGTECSWLVETSRGTKLTLEFIDDFSIRCEWGTCVHWVEVNTNSDVSIPGYRFCCTRRPQTVITSHTGQIVINFRSPQHTSYTYKGFKAIIKAVSSGSQNVGPVTSPTTTTTSTTLRTTTRPTTRPTRRTTTTTTTTTPTTTTTTTSTTTTTTSTTTTTTVPPTTTTSTTTTTTEKQTKYPTTTTKKPQVEESDDDDDDGDYYSWTDWGECKHSQCNCGGCSRVYRYRLCGDRQCTGNEARRQEKVCNTKICTARDTYQIYIGRFYPRPCSTCCTGYWQSGDRCVRSGS